MTYRERRERRADRRRTWADSRDTKAASSEAGASQIVNGIPLGQPILVGHHSEKRHRRDVERATNGFRKAHEHRQMADHHRQSADTIERQLDTAVYSDDTDAVERLEARIAEREAQRDRRKAINADIAKRIGGRRKMRLGYGETDPETAAAAARAVAQTIKALELDAGEQKDLLQAIQFNAFVGYPPYAIANLSGSLKRDRDRLAKLQTVAAQRARVREYIAAEREAEQANQ